jgi:hypothetical protein
MGRMLVEIVPDVPISATVRTGVSIFSYCDNLSFGITGNYGYLRMARTTITSLNLRPSTCHA